ncbi:hypothetical protein EYC84_001453 [Monilinia fructicola]|uniref:Clock-controlled protein 6 n=1 Tax=Monilinia fructicola TaxID=38448 RepID=A0A5M9JSS8_MONFR|nr:hypothetical protein EYC84_001453 [Monilinia fructicola]
MQFSTVAIISALAAAVSANGNYSTTVSAVWVTDVVTSFTTVCPAATTLSYNGVTYTATENQTVTITNCPCTVSKPVYTTSTVICNTCTTAPTTAPVVSGPAYGKQHCSSAYRSSYKQGRICGLAGLLGVAAYLL